MGEYIADNFKREAMKVPLLRELLMTDSVYIASNITFDNLAPLSTYLGKPGDPAKGGVPFAEYMRRQAQHRAGRDGRHAGHRRASSTAPRTSTATTNFVCDTSGSICEVVERRRPRRSGDDGSCRDNLLLVWIKGSDAHTAELIRRFDRAPKPMYYQPAFLAELWAEYLAQRRPCPKTRSIPMPSCALAYARAAGPPPAALCRDGALGRHRDRRRGGRTCATPADFDDLIARALDRRALTAA